MLWNLTLPSSVAFDTAGNTFVSEAGQGFGGLSPTPRILKIDHNGTISVLTDKFLVGPVTSMVYHQGKIYVANKGKISTVNPANGGVQDIITDLPAGGDHPTNAIVFGPDGRLLLSARKCNKQWSCRRRQFFIESRLARKVRHLCMMYLRIILL